MTDVAITELLFVGSTGAARVEVDHWIDGCGSTRSVSDLRKSAGSRS